MLFVTRWRLPLTSKCCLRAPLNWTAARGRTVRTLKRQGDQGRFNTAPQLVKRMAEGEVADILIAPPAVLDEQANNGRFPTQGRLMLGRVGAGSSFARARLIRISQKLYRHYEGWHDLQRHHDEVVEARSGEEAFAQRKRRPSMSPAARSVSAFGGKAAAGRTRGRTATRAPMFYRTAS